MRKMLNAALYAQLTALLPTTTFTANRVCPEGEEGGCLAVSCPDRAALQALGRLVAAALGVRYAERGDPTFERNPDDSLGERGVFYNTMELIVHPGLYVPQDFS